MATKPALWSSPRSSWPSIMRTFCEWSPEFPCTNIPILLKSPSSDPWISGRSAKKSDWIKIPLGMNLQQHYQIIITIIHKSLFWLLKNLNRATIFEQRIALCVFVSPSVRLWNAIETFEVTSFKSHVSLFWYSISDICLKQILLD